MEIRLEIARSPGGLSFVEKHKPYDKPNDKQSIYRPCVCREFDCDRSVRKILKEAFDLGSKNRFQMNRKQIAFPLAEH